MYVTSRIRSAAGIFDWCISHSTEIPYLAFVHENYYLFLYYGMGNQISFSPGYEEYGKLKEVSPNFRSSVDHSVLVFPRVMRNFEKEDT